MRELFHALGAGNCLSCGERPDAGGAGLQGNLCHECQEALDDRLMSMTGPPDRVRAGWYGGAYAGPLGRLVRRTKYQGDARLGNALARWSAGRVGALDVDAVVAVPTPWTRALLRGVALPELIAAHLAEASGVPVIAALRRTEHRGRQATHARRDRSRRPGFRARQPLEGRVLLVDDVVTTGSTATACADELLGAGASEVWLYAIAAATPDVRR